jgi:hypothetical protein
VSITAILIISTVIIWVIFDVYIIYKKGKHASISAYLIRWFREYSLVSFLTGMVMGHFFWSMPTENIYKNVECKEVGNATDKK